MVWVLVVVFVFDVSVCGSVVLLCGVSVGNGRRCWCLVLVLLGGLVLVLVFVGGGGG